MSANPPGDWRASAPPGPSSPSSWPSQGQPSYAPPPAAAPYPQAQPPQPQYPQAQYPQAQYQQPQYPQAQYQQPQYPEAGSQPPPPAASYPPGSQPATWGAPPAADPVQPAPPPASQMGPDVASPAAAPGTAPGARAAGDRAPVLGGLVVVGIGLFLLLGQVVSDAGQWIPLFIGLVFLAAFVARREYGFLVAGSIITGVGAGVVLQDVAPDELSDAVTTLCIAAGFLSIWVVGTLLRLPGNHWWPFIPGGVLALVGASQLSEADVDGVLRWWPLIIVAIGVLIIARAWLGSRRRV